MSRVTGEPAEQDRRPAKDAALSASASRAQSGSLAGLSIREFLTDASFAALCADLGEMTGLTIQLRDEAGRLIIHDPESPENPWVILDQDEAGPVHDAAFRAPVRVQGHAIGELIVGPGEPHLRDGARTQLTDAIGRLAASGSELCEDVLELRHRVKELGVLFRLSRLLASRETTVETMLDAALESSLEAFELDCGSIVLLPEDADGVPTTNHEGDLLLKASRGLSDGWLASPLPLSTERLFDRLVLQGEVLAVEDLLTDTRVLSRERLLAEGVRSFFSAAMIFRDRPIGVIRLYGREPRRFSTAERRLLRPIADQSATAVQQARLHAIQKRERRIERQLRVAGEVQSRMLPRSMPDVPGIDVAGRSVPTNELGGDFYDAFEVGGNIGLVIGDVVGKGVPAAIIMSAVLASLRAHAQILYDIDQQLARVNVAMCRDTLPNEFATLWYGVLDPDSLRLTYTSAGHDPPFVIRVPKGESPTRDHVKPLGVGGLVVGVDPDQDYPRYVMELEPGDVLISHTDGLPDARSFTDEKWGWDRMVDAAVDAVSLAPDVSAEAILEHILWTLRKFTGLRKQVDDETILVVRVSPEARTG